MDSPSRNALHRFVNNRFVNALCAGLLLLIGALTLKRSGWRSTEWVGWSLMGIGISLQGKPKGMLFLIASTLTMVAGAILLMLNAFHH